MKREGKKSKGRERKDLFIPLQEFLQACMTLLTCLGMKHI